MSYRVPTGDVGGPVFVRTLDTCTAGAVPLVDVREYRPSQREAWCDTLL